MSTPTHHPYSVKVTYRISDRNAGNGSKKKTPSQTLKAAIILSSLLHPPGPPVTDFLPKETRLSKMIKSPQKLLKPAYCHANPDTLDSHRYDCLFLGALMHALALRSVFQGGKAEAGVAAVG